MRQKRAKCWLNVVKLGSSGDHNPRLVLKSTSHPSLTRLTRTLCLPGHDALLTASEGGALWGGISQLLNFFFAKRMLNRAGC